MIRFILTRIPEEFHRRGRGVRGAEKYTEKKRSLKTFSFLCDLCVLGGRIFLGCRPAALGRFAISLLLGVYLALTQVGAAAAADFDYRDWAEVLAAYVDDTGAVDYRGLRANRGRLSRFLKQIDALNPNTFETWPRNEKIAFWLNTYNAMTVDIVARHYPIEPNVPVSIFYPKNSIRQIAGVFEDVKAVVMGRSISLDDIEHRELRKEFNEPRIHMALVCAARSCPPLRNEPYVGRDLDRQLDDQARRFLSDPLKFRIDGKQGRVYVSSIFDWFGQDFVPGYSQKAAVKRGSAKEQAVLSFIYPYLPPHERTFIETGRYDVEFVRYDWSLNEKPERRRDDET